MVQWSRPGRPDLLQQVSRCVGRGIFSPYLAAVFQGFENHILLVAVALDCTGILGRQGIVHQALGRFHRVVGGVEQVAIGIGHGHPYRQVHLPFLLLNLVLLALGEVIHPVLAAQNVADGLELAGDVDGPVQFLTVG